jgi:transposase-like protein
MGKLRRKHSPEFKQEAVKLVKEGGVKVSEAARDLDIHQTSLRRWINQYDTDHGEGQTEAFTTKEKEELRRLRRDVRIPKEND